MAAAKPKLGARSLPRRKPHGLIIKLNRPRTSRARQAFALCPSSAEALYRYVNVLVDQKRFQDSRRLTEVTQILDPTGGNYHQLLEELNRLEANANKGK